MAFNPNAVFISPSTIADFDKCPQLYYYRNVYRSPRGLKIQIINPSMALGQAVHDILNQFLKLPPSERIKDELVKAFEFVWQNISGEKGGFLSQEEEKVFKERANLMLERFWKKEHFRLVEPVKIPEFPKVDLGNDIMLTGKLDWIEEEPDGFHIIDFKTGKNEEKEDSKQLPIYAVLVGNLLKSSNIRTSYWYLDRDDDFISISLPMMEETLKDLQKKGEIIKMVRQTNSFRCQSGGESCWACRDILSIAQGKGKLVNMDPVNRKQEIYILRRDRAEDIRSKSLFETKEDELPF